MYTLVKSDEEFRTLDPMRGCSELPIGYPCLFKTYNKVETKKDNNGEYTRNYVSVYDFIYVPPNIKNLESFVLGVNAVK